MVGILLVTHAPLGRALLETLSHIYHARPAQFEVIDVLADQCTDAVALLLRDAVDRLEQGQGVLVMTDIAGGTPANCAALLREDYHVEIIAGANVSMLLRAITYQMEPLEIVAQMALAGGQAGITVLDNRIRLAN